MSSCTCPAVKPSGPHAGLQGGTRRRYVHSSPSAKVSIRGRVLPHFPLHNISGTFAQQRQALSSLDLCIIPSLGEAGPELPTLCLCLFSRRWQGDFCPAAPARPAQGPALSQPGDDGATLGFQCSLVGSRADPEGRVLAGQPSSAFCHGRGTDSKRETQPRRRAVGHAVLGQGLLCGAGRCHGQELRLAPQ